MSGRPQPDQPGRLDLARRRLVDRLRADLGVQHLPPHAGAELRVLAPVVREQLRLRDVGDELLPLLARAVEEFAHIVDNRPLPAPLVQTQLASVVLDRGTDGLVAFERALDILHEVMRELWDRPTDPSSHAAALDTAWARYAARLLDRVRGTCLSGPGPADDDREPASAEELVAEVTRRWGGTSLRFCVLVGACSTSRADGPASRRMIAADHVVEITVRSARDPARGAARPAVPTPTGAVRVGPVPADQVAAAYATALVRYYLVDAGVAEPPATALPLPDLGFMAPRPTRATADRIADLLLPLTDQPRDRRVALAQTMQLRLRSTGTVQILARRLGRHSSTVSKQLSTLRELFGEDLDRRGSAVATLAALDLVLPLWEHEDGASSSGRDRSGNCAEIAPGPVPVL